MIDLRSDTFTLPTPGMLDAMMRAEVGDDVWGEDPTVQALEALAARTLGQEAGLFCPSGTMTNQLAIRAQARPGEEVICSIDAHVYRYEGGGIAANAGASVRPLEGDRGRFTAEDVLCAIQPDDVHCPRTVLIAVEDTQNRGGGAIWDQGTLDAIRTVADENSLRIHLDGARVFNRLVATGDDPAAYGRRFDSISVCLSKGLGTPVGSVLLGGRDFIKRAHRIRKVMGGAMRQAGYLAAAGIFALEHQVERLADDHRRAKALEEALNASPRVRAVLPVQTNIVIFDPDPGFGVKACLDGLARHDVRAAAMGPRVRLVTHLGVDDAGIDRAIAAIRAWG